MLETSILRVSFTNHLSTYQWDTVQQIKSEVKEGNRDRTLFLIHERLTENGHVGVLHEGEEVGRDRHLAQVRSRVVDLHVLNDHSRLVRGCQLQDKEEQIEKDDSTYSWKSFPHDPHFTLSVTTFSVPTLKHSPARKA